MVLTYLHFTILKFPLIQGTKVLLSTAKWRVLAAQVGICRDLSSKTGDGIIRNYQKLGFRHQKHVCSQDTYGFNQHLWNQPGQMNWIEEAKTACWPSKHVGFNPVHFINGNWGFWWSRFKIQGLHPTEEMFLMVCFPTETVEFPGRIFVLNPWSMCCFSPQWASSGSKKNNLGNFVPAEVHLSVRQIRLQVYTKCSHTTAIYNRWVWIWAFDANFPCR